MNDPQWLVEAKKHLGVRELPGAPTQPVISRWLAQLGAWWKDDETPWCGVAVAAWFKTVGYPLPKHWYRAKGWLDWGVMIDRPTIGAVAVLERPGGGHVGLIVGFTPDSVTLIGGNQGNAVSIANFPRQRVVGYRWPVGEPWQAQGRSAGITGAPGSPSEA